MLPNISFDRYKKSELLGDSILEHIAIELLWFAPVISTSYGTEYVRVALANSKFFHALIERDGGVILLAWVFNDIENMPLDTTY
jgi:hypothetical protein